MIVCREPDGTQALYVGGVTGGEIIPELATIHPPRVSGPQTVRVYTRRRCTGCDQYGIRHPTVPSVTARWWSTTTGCS